MLITTAKQFKFYISTVLDAHSEESNELSQMTTDEFMDVIQEICEANEQLIPFETDNFDSPTINFLDYI